MSSLVILVASVFETSCGKGDRHTDRDGHETLKPETETRPRRDVCRSRDVTESLK